VSDGVHHNFALRSENVAAVAANLDPMGHLEGASGQSALGEPTISFSGRTENRPGGRGPVARFFVAVGLSLYGDWLTTVALVVVLFEFTGSPAGPAGYVFVRVAPRLLGPWWGGQLADRFSPRKLMVASSMLQAIATLSLIASATHRSVLGIYLAVATSQFVGALGRPSHGAMVPSLVIDRLLSRANATYGLFLNTSIFVGPALGAVLLVHVGPNPLFAIDAGTFMVSALLAATLPSGVRESQVARANERHLPGGGSSVVLSALRRPEVRMVAAANFVSGMTVTVAQALLVVAAHERFGGDTAVGYLYSGVGIGGAVGGLIALRWVPPRSWTRFSVFLAATAEVVALAGFSTTFRVPFALLLLAVSAVAGSSFDTWGLTEVQRLAPPSLMGRFNSIIFISLYAGMLVGAAWALSTANVLQWETAIQYACAAALVIVGAVWISGGSRDSLIQEKNNPEETEPPQGLVSER
jgi:predicted MFS family arabinose efflux permease